MDVIFKRVSVRAYQEREVEEEKLERLLRAAMAAPSAKNQQPWEFYVVKRKEVIRRLADCSPNASCAADAPALIVLCTRKDENGDAAYGDRDMSAATENILLEAVYLGLGAVWLGIAPFAERMEMVKETLKLPEELEAFALVPVGYPLKEKEQKDRFQRERVHWVN